MRDGLDCVRDGNRQTGRTTLMLTAVKQAAEEGRRPYVLAANAYQAKQMLDRLVAMGVVPGTVRAGSNPQGAEVVFRDHFYVESAWYHAETDLATVERCLAEIHKGLLYIISQATDLEEAREVARKIANEAMPRRSLGWGAVREGDRP